MQKTSLVVEKKYLIFRSETKNLRDIIGKMAIEKENNILYLDFLRVSFFSRSFADELLNMLEDFEAEGLIIKIINLKPDLEKFLKQIKERKIEIKKEMAG